mmetsp:Transcript_29177/g.36217  ORF Transcript_29177/g.36217 Transcript_29177/m.36217 type:complete len:111 (+) Transcript_29177:198-530(+)
MLLSDAQSINHKRCLPNSARFLSLIELRLILGLLDKLTDGALQLVDLLAHLVDTVDDVAVHLAEARLHLVKHLRHQVRQLLSAVHIVRLRTLHFHFALLVSLLILKFPFI